MRKTKLYLFKINGEVVHELSTGDVDWELTKLENFKGCIAASLYVKFEDIEVEAKDVFLPELSDKFFVRTDGSLMCNPHTKLQTWGNNVINPHYVKGLQPAYDLNHTELMEEWLSLILKGDIDNAITFF